MRIRALAVLLPLVIGCRGPDPAASGRPSGRTYGTETWYEAALGASPTEVVLRFDGPQGAAGDECAPEREVAVDADDTEVNVTVRRYAPSPVVACPASPQTITATLPGPIGDRPLVNPQTGWRFRMTAGRLALDPESTPCARADCSAPAVAKAGCKLLEYGAVVGEQLKPGKGPDEDVRCDGSFLVMTRDGRRAWFVNREATWRLVSADVRTCDDLWKAHRIHFPAPMCR
jgi:hypothetical protein